ncbi:MAG: hypothetical protein SFU91_00735 [Chloroherpetonaceae bacterium]|nr:hypothetical protein [Chloroherpetonaceae bacterium]
MTNTIQFARLYRVIAASFFILFFAASCKNTIDFDPIPEIRPSKGVYVLNQGLFQGNNATLTYYDIDSNKAVTDFYEQKNGKKLGDTGNDIAIYGSKMYVVVNGSSRLEVINPFTGISLKTVPLFDSSFTTPRARSPRKMAFGDGFVFISCYDGSVVKIDTMSLSVVAIGRAGSNPEGIAYVNGKLYVANSGGLNFPNYDSTLSILSATSLATLKTLTVRINLIGVQRDASGDVYVVSQGNYGDIPPRLFVINTSADTIKQRFDIDISQIAISGDTLLFNSNSNIGLLRASTKQILTQNFISGSQFGYVYNFSRDEQNGKIYVSDAKSFVVSGEVTRFSAQGTKEATFATGIVPDGIVFLR